MRKLCCRAVGNRAQPAQICLGAWAACCLLPWETGKVPGALQKEGKDHFCPKPTEQCLGRAVGAQECSIPRMKRTHCVRGDATSGLQEGFWFEERFQIPAAQVREKTGSGVGNNTWLSQPALAAPGGRRFRRVRSCVLSFPLPRNVKETSPAIAHAAFVPHTALCCCKLALFIKCVYLAADLLLHMNNWQGKCHWLHGCCTILAAEFPTLQRLEQEALNPISPFTELNFGYVSYLGTLPNCWKWQNQMW